MIEWISAERCTACNICVTACPTNVFDLVPGGPPRIARQNDCQTCFMCELYCPEDALFVAPQADVAMAVDGLRWHTHPCWAVTAKAWVGGAGASPRQTRTGATSCCLPDGNR